MERVNSPGAILSRDNVVPLLVTARQRAARDKAGPGRKSHANFRAPAASGGGGLRGAPGRAEPSRAGGGRGRTAAPRHTPHTSHLRAGAAPPSARLWCRQRGCGAEVSSGCPSGPAVVSRCLGSGSLTPGMWVRRGRTLGARRGDAAFSAASHPLPRQCNVTVNAHRVWSAPSTVRAPNAGSGELRGRTRAPARSCSPGERAASTSDKQIRPSRYLWYFLALCCENRSDLGYHKDRGCELRAALFCLR